MNTRKLQISDYNKNLNNLLSQLTECPKITQQEFEIQFSNLSENNLHLVVEKNNKIIAYGTLIVDFKFYRNCKNIGHIEDIVVDKNERGKGISKIVLNKLIEYGLEKNCYKFILNCDDKYINFYKNLGFENKGHNMVKYNS